MAPLSLERANSWPATSDSLGKERARSAEANIARSIIPLKWPARGALGFGEQERSGGDVSSPAGALILSTHLFLRAIAAKA